MTLPQGIRPTNQKEYFKVLRHWSSSTPEVAALPRCEIPHCPRWTPRTWSCYCGLVKNTKHPQKHIFIAHSLQRQDLCFDHTILRSSRIHRICWLGTVLPSVGSLTCSLYSCFETAEPHALYIHDLVAVLNTWLVEMVAAAGKTRLHEKCWNGYTKSGTHLNKKGVRVNTCVRVKKQTKSGK